LNNTKKILMENDRIIINNYWGYLGDKYLLYLGPLIFFGVLIKIAIEDRNLIVFLIAILILVLAAFTTHVHKKTSRHEEGYQYIIDKSKQLLIIKKIEGLSIKTDCHSISYKLKMKITGGYDSEEEKPYFDLFICIYDKELLIQQSFNKNEVRKQIDDIILFLDIPNMPVEESKSVFVIAKSDSSKEKSLDGLNIKESVPDTAIRLLRDKLDEMNIQEGKTRLPLLEETYTVKVVNQKLIINVGRNFILFFITLILCSLLTYYMLLGNTITLEQTANNSIVCEIKYTFLGVDKLVVNRLTLTDIKDIITETDDEGDTTYIFKHQNYNTYKPSLKGISQEDLQAMKAFLKEDVHNPGQQLIVKGETHILYILFSLFLMVQTLSMIISSVSILLKIKIKKILINKDNEKIVVTFSKALKKENQEYPLDILDNIEIKEISNDKFLFIQILNKSLSLGNIRGSKKLSEIGMFIESL
jgi:hypothetical protein